MENHTLTIYEKKIKPKIKDIVEWYVNGFTLGKIVDMLGVNVQTFWRARKEHEDFNQVIESLKEIKVENAEISLYQRCIGYEKEVKKHVKVKTEYYDDSGRKCSKEELVEYDETIYIPSDTNAIRFYLLNNASDRYRSEQPEINITNELLTKSDSVLVKIKNLADSLNK